MVKAMVRQWMLKCQVEYGRTRTGSTHTWAKHDDADDAPPIDSSLFVLFKWHCSRDADMGEDWGEMAAWTHERIHRKKYFTVRWEFSKLYSGWLGWVGYAVFECFGCLEYCEQIAKIEQAKWILFLCMERKGIRDWDLDTTVRMRTGGDGAYLCKTMGVYREWGRHVVLQWKFSFWVFAKQHFN